MMLPDLLAPLLLADPLAWHGLPDVDVAVFEASFGPAAERVEAVLGAIAATRDRYRHGDADLVVWSRGGRACMVEAPVMPAWSVLAALGSPDRVLPHEILVPDAYAHEYLYGRRGLLLTVAQALRGGVDRIVRCRGIRALDDPAGLGPDLYCAFEDRVHWALPALPTRATQRGRR